MSINIALAGNPNSGKTTLFNELTGSNQFVGNWPGVTVEKKKVNSKNMTRLRLLTYREFIRFRRTPSKKWYREIIS